jgi:1-acyl-sn-glycerol-3-phosphate acyltransferase
MYEIMRLSGQEYVDVYAPRAKELAAKAKKDAAELPVVDPGPGAATDVADGTEQKKAS